MLIIQYVIYYRIEEADKIGPALLWEVIPMATFTFSFKNFNELWGDIYRITYHQWGGASISTRLTCSHPPDCRVRSWLWYVRDPDHNKDEGEEEVTTTTSHPLLIVPTQHSGSTTSNSIYKIYITRGASRVFITFLSCHSCFRYMCNSPARILLSVMVNSFLCSLIKQSWNLPPWMCLLKNENCFSFKVLVAR